MRPYHPTPRQLEFARLVITEGKPLIDAYEAVSPSRGETRRKHTAQRAAGRLAQNPRVRAEMERLAALERAQNPWWRRAEAEQTLAALAAAHGPLPRGRTPASVRLAAQTALRQADREIRQIARDRRERELAELKHLVHAALVARLSEAAHTTAAASSNISSNIANTDSDIDSGIPDFADLGSLVGLAATPDDASLADLERVVAEAQARVHETIALPETAAWRKAAQTKPKRRRTLPTFTRRVVGTGM